MKYKILLVEDESIEAMNFQQYLISFGYDVIGIASTGEEAIKKVIGLEVDLVLMDIVLKGDMDGIEAAAKIRDIIDIPVIYLTAHLEESVIKRTKLTSPYGYIVKPVNKTILQNTIELALYKHQMEIKSKESEVKYRELFDSPLDMIALSEVPKDSKPGKFIEVNKTGIERLGYTQEEFSNMTPLDIVDPEIHPEIPSVIERINKFDYDKFETINVSKEGKKIPVEVYSQIIELHGEKFLLSVSRDITQRKKAEEILRIEKELAFTLNESSDLIEKLNICLEGAIKISGMDSGCIYLVDDGSRDIELKVHSGLSSDFVDDVSYYEADSPHARIVMEGKPIYSTEKLGIPIPQSHLKEKFREVAFIPIHHQGEVIANLILASHTKYTISDQSQKALETIAGQIDGAIIRSKAEEALFESEKRYRELVDNSLVPIYETNLKGEILYANDAMAKISGYESVTELKTINIVQFYPNPSVRDEFIRKIKKFKTIHQQEAKAVSKTGKIYDVIINAYLSGDTVSVMIMDITERKKAEEEIRTSLAEKELLINEIHHRVKNNLQIISSLLNLQEQFVTENPAAINILKGSQNRVISMAMIHEILYQSKDFGHVNLSDYVTNLVSNLSYSYSQKAITNINVDEAYLNIETAVPCGLIISELVSNSLKHAFPDDYNGELSVKLESTDEEYELVISDNGIGLPENLDFRNIESSLGLKLVNILVQQIGGSIALDRIEGTKFSIKFKEQQYKKRT